MSRALWMLLELTFYLKICQGLTETELSFLKQMIGSRPNLMVNGKPANKFEMAEDASTGLLWFKTNSRPGYIEPGKAGYPLQRNREFYIRRYPMYGNISTCVPTNEPVGISIYGTLIYSVSLAKPGCPQADRARAEVPNGTPLRDFDECGGQATDMLYRVYSWSECLENLTCSQPSAMIGVALDGFPIYGPIDETGRQLTTVDLDECHGKVASDGSYRYYATRDYPYFISCFRGIMHEKAGITYPVKCTCPHNDTSYFRNNRTPFPHYTIAYEWVPIRRNLSLFPCSICTTTRRGYRPIKKSRSWLNYNSQMIDDLKVCNETTEYRFVEVIKRRLRQGRLPPEQEFEFYKGQPFTVAVQGNHKHSKKSIAVRGCMSQVVSIMVLFLTLTANFL